MFAYIVYNGVRRFKTYDIYFKNDHFNVLDGFVTPPNPEVFNKNELTPCVAKVYLIITCSKANFKTLKK